MSEAPKSSATRKRREEGPWVLPPPWLPADYEVADVVAVQSLHAGTANSDQQQRALKWIVREACGYADLGWHPLDAHNASFAAGRRFAALQIEKLIHLDRSILGGKTSGQKA